MRPLEAKLSGCKHTTPIGSPGEGGSVSRVNVMQALRQEGVQIAEGTSQLQDWSMKRKDLKSRRQIGEFENGNAEERGVCSRRQ